ncbi:MAG: hypothetical protein JSW07_15540 [bacterium]|nr:MAG: hypothetical protein JSW07_15540 [bacterium]
MVNKKLLEEIILKHYNYLKSVNFKGWDVLDGLNSRLFQKLPFHRNKYFRLFWIQFFRKSPVNFRTVALIPQEHNPKALALFISGLLYLYYYFQDETFREQSLMLYDRLIQFKSKNYSGLSWGYNFDWQARAFNVPKFKPNMVCSVFAGQALIDLFEVAHNEEFLLKAKGIADFIVNDLLLVKEESNLCFGYIPDEPAIIHNVNLLGAAYLARLYEITKDEQYQSLAEKAVRFTVTYQREDGAWAYGKQKHHQWVDNFHTGYNLVSIISYQKYCHNKQFDHAIIKGLDFHLKNHYTENFLPKYSAQNLYPLDIHCFAQAIITFFLLKDYLPEFGNKIELILKNVVRLFWDRERHYFWYKKSRFFKSKIPYIRWSQAWMFYSLSYLMAGLNEETNRITWLSGG